jgi:GT2 family glycosyltransferase
MRDLQFTVLVYGDGPESSTDVTVRSLLDQTYPSWTWVDHGASGGSDSASLPHDPPVPVGAELTYVVALPRGSRLHRTALQAISEVVSAEGSRLVTWDATVRDGEQDRDVLGFGWSPETLLSFEYTGGCFALSLEDYRAAISALGASAASPWSLLLRLPVDLEPTRHIAEPLVMLPAPVAVAEDVATKTVNAGLRYRQVPATSVVVDGIRRLRWELTSWPTVTIVIPTRHNEALLTPLFASLATTASLPGGPRFDVVVVDNGERTPDAEAFYAREWKFPVSVTWWDETPFHYGRVNNAGVALSGSEYVLLLNDDTLVVEPGWLAEMLGLAMLPGVGVVGTTLLTQDGRIQHAGVWVGLGGYAGHHFAGLAPRTETIFGSTSWYRNLLAVTAACLCVRKELFESVGGFDEEMILAGSDVTLGLDCVARGLRNICSPVPGLHHYESLTRSSATLNDQIVSLLRYQPWHDAGDPYRNARLSQKTPVPTLRSDGETDLVGASRARAGVHL